MNILLIGEWSHYNYFDKRLKIYKIINTNIISIIYKFTMLKTNVS